jgi:hypothetical protein
MPNTSIDDLSIGDVAELLVQKLDKREAELSAEITKVRDFRDGFLGLAAPTSEQHALPSTHAADAGSASARPARVLRPKVADKPASKKRGRPAKSLTSTRADVEASAPAKRTNTNWANVHEALVSGETDQYVTVIKTSSVDSTKSTLLKRFPDLGVKIINKDDGTSMFGVRLRSDAELAA